MRLDADEIQKIHGRYGSPTEVRVDDVFIDPWGIVWRATDRLNDTPPAPNHAAISAVQLSIDKKGTIDDWGKDVVCEVPLDQQCKILNQMTWKVELETLFYFEPDA